jgi:hypothetical protein
MDGDRFLDPSNALSTIGVSSPPSSENSWKTRLKALAVCLDDLAEIFQSKLSPRQIQLYAEALSDISVPLLDAAVKRIIRTRPRYFPTPGEIREAVSAQLEDDEREAENGLLALADLREENEREGRELREAERARWNAEHPGESPLPQSWREQHPILPRRSPRYFDEPMRPLRELITYRLPDVDHPDVQEWLHKMGEASADAA